VSNLLLSLNKEYQKMIYFSSIEYRSAYTFDIENKIPYHNGRR